MESQVARQVASKFAKMEITKPEVMRVTRAYQAFRRFALALRPGEQDFYHKSFMSKKISSFWSHSWHGECKMKIMTLLVLHNGCASLVIGSFTAIAMMVCSCLGVLPGLVRNPSQGDLMFSNWALGGGLIATALTFLLWRSRRLVFFDRICINQHDTDLKTESIYSLGGIVRNSREMLVLWDSTWSERLWCQFEFAAFLSKRTNEQVLTIRPTFLGACSCGLFVVTSISAVLMPFFPMEISTLPILGSFLAVLFCGYFVVAALRRYFRTVETLKEKMRSFSFDQSKAACCDLDHDFDGHPIVCDRQIVRECVSIWFGQQEAFEDYVRSQVAENLAIELERGVFTRSWNLSVTMPFMWGTLDASAAYIAVGDYEAGMARFLAGFVLWFLCGPIFIDGILYLAWRFSRRSTCSASEIMINLAMPAAMLGLVVLAANNGSLLPLLAFSGGSKLQGAGVFAASWCLLALGHLLMKEIVSRKCVLVARIRGNAL